TGKISISPRVRARVQASAYTIQGLAAKFPARREQGILRGKQGISGAEQGNLFAASANERAGFFGPGPTSISRTRVRRDGAEGRTMCQMVQRLRHGIHLVVMDAVREARTSVRKASSHGVRSGRKTSLFSMVADCADMRMTLSPTGSTS